MAHPLLEVTRAQTAWHGTDHDLSALSRVFHEQHFLILPGFLERPLFDHAAEEIARSLFQIRRYEDVGEDECMEENRLSRLLETLMNDPALLRLLESITGCPRVNHFSGRVYRMRTQTNAAQAWHDDLDGRRLVAFSLNLSPGSYEGGRLEMRRAGSLLANIANTGPGDALLFRIAEGFEHRVSPVSGPQPKIAYAGWFEKSSTALESNGMRQATGQAAQ